MAGWSAFFLSTQGIYEILDKEGVMTLKSISELDVADPDCPVCLGGGWTCELHEDRPWSSIVGDELGCAPDCPGPGVPCKCNQLSRVTPGELTP